MMKFHKRFRASEKKIQITNHKYQMVRQAVRQAHGPEQSRRTHHLTTLSQAEGQITKSEFKILNNWRLILVEILILRFGIYL